MRHAGDRVPLGRGARGDRGGPRRRHRRQLGRRRRRARGDRPISPETCRAYAEERFKPERMVADYLAAYETLLLRPRSRACPSSAAGPSHDWASTSVASCTSMSATAGSPARRTNSSCGMPSRTQPAQRSSASWRRARWSGASLSTPKWISARHSGSRRAISSSRGVPGLDVDVGRRRGREDVARGLQADAARRRRRAARRRGSRRRGAWRGPASGTPPSRPRRRSAMPDVRLGHRHELLPEAVEVVAVEPPRRGLEPRRVDEVRRADLGHPDGQLRDAAARSTRPRPRGRSGCARAAGAGCRSARGRARARPPRAAAASSPGRSRGARGRRRSRRRRRRSPAQAEEVQVERVEHRARA